jgi:hypothetical protein
MEETLNQSDQQTFLPDWIDTAAEEARSVALGMLRERGRGAVLVGVARLDTAMEKKVHPLSGIVGDLLRAHEATQLLQNPPAAFVFEAVFKPTCRLWLARGLRDWGWGAEWRPVQEGFPASLRARSTLRVADVEPHGCGPERADQGAHLRQRGCRPSPVVRWH